MTEQSEFVTPVNTTTIKPNTSRPTARQWLLHATLLVLTAFTTTICGIMMAGPELEPSSGAGAGTNSFVGNLLMIPWYYLGAIMALVRHAFTHVEVLKEGLIFSGSFLAILASHESGHYVFCRRYGVEATLPFFIPQPPLLIPGTFGAFIRMKSPVPSRRALFDIGLAGPLAGFVVMVPIAIAGVLVLEHKPVPPGSSGITFNDPLLFRLIGRAFRISLEDGVVNSFYLAAWFGALVTALNLMPVGQLDGGHGTFALFGEKAHHWIGRALFVAMMSLSVLGWLWYGSPAWFVFVLLLLVMLRMRHPPPQQMEPLGTARIIIGIVTLIVFALCFLPFPITIT